MTPSNTPKGWQQKLKRTGERTLRVQEKKRGTWDMQEREEITTHKEEEIFGHRFQWRTKLFCKWERVKSRESSKVDWLGGGED